MVLDEGPLDGAVEVFLEVVVGVVGSKKKNHPSLFHTPTLSIHTLTLNPSVNARCASLNSGVENDRRGSSSRAAASSLATCARSSASRDAASGVADAPARRSKSACVGKEVGGRGLAVTGARGVATAHPDPFSLSPHQAGGGGRGGGGGGHGGSCCVCGGLGCVGLTTTKKKGKSCACSPVLASLFAAGVSCSLGNVAISHSL